MWRLIGCPNCYRDYEPYMFKAKNATDKPYQQTCEQCGHVFFYSEKDILTDKGWMESETVNPKEV